MTTMSWQGFRPREVVGLLGLFFGLITVGTAWGQSPAAVLIFPQPGTTVSTLKQVEVHFDVAVTNVRAADLLVNSAPATNVTVLAPDAYVFDLPAISPGPVQVAWDPTNQIVDAADSSKRFTGTPFSYALDPTLANRAVRINEIMAANDNGIRDEEGRRSDWIELFNASNDPVDIGGWFLTDEVLVPAKWRIPDGVVMAAKAYLLVWASGADRTNSPVALHTNFKVSSAPRGNIELVYNDGLTVMSAYTNYPQQYSDVSYGADRVTPSTLGYFVEPTPEKANATLGPGFGPGVTFSVAGGSFQEAFDLALSTADPQATIRYVLVTNGTTAKVSLLPDSSSALYTGPIRISGTTQVRARSFPTNPGFFPGPVTNQTYMFLGGAVTNFSSDLPIVVFHTMGGGAVATWEDQFITMEVFDNKFGRTSLTNKPDLVVQGYFHRRGQTSMGLAKANLRVETQDAYGENLDVELLGLPSENDWVFYGIDSYDKALMHNPLSHQLYREMGHYSSRTRFVEVFLKDDSGKAGPIVTNDYNGLYVLEEKIKIGKNRVDIPRLRPQDRTPPAVTGGYLLSIDKSNPNWADWVADTIVWYLDPDFSMNWVPEQMEYARNYLDSFYTALQGPNWTDPEIGYPAYIDMPSWIDYHLLQTLVFSADALRISAYFHIPRNGKIVQGPLWDFDRAWGTRTGDDARGFNPRKWYSSESDGGTDMFNPGRTFNNPWYSRMFMDPDFWQRWIDRYQELRRSTFSLAHINSRIDAYAEEVREATAREYARWPGNATPRGGAVSGDGMTYQFPDRATWQGEVEFSKYWFSNRFDFIDSNFLNPPVFSTNGTGTGAYILTITAPTRITNSTIFYTLDGTDPRLPGGAVSSAAFSGTNVVSVLVTNNVRVFARNWNAAHRNQTGYPGKPPLSSSWSGPNVASFVVGTPPLRITEIMYNPSSLPSDGGRTSDEFEFIELQNTGSGELNLSGYTLSGDVNLRLGDYTLAAGATAVLVRNVEAFASRYPGVTNIAGVYTNKLNNSGGHLVLTGPVQEPVLDFTFKDGWYPTTDGLGFSLAIRDPQGPPESWDTKAAWQTSSGFLGSPGAVNPVVTFPAVAINEALTHTDPPQVDTIELFNPSSNAVDVSNWFLTDDPKNPRKFAFPADTLISAYGYLVVDAGAFGTGTNGFNLSSTGDQVYLFSGDTNGALTGYAHGFSFGAAPNGVSFGRHLDSAGREHFVLQSTNTLNGTNAPPRVGPVIFSEISYHPPVLPSGAPDALGEYVELLNTAATNVPLYDPLAPTNTWRLGKAVSYAFPANVEIPSGGRLLVVPFDPIRDPAVLSAFIQKYGLAQGVQMYGPWEGKLANEGEGIQLLRPDSPNVTATNIVVPYYEVEQVVYNDKGLWPAEANGGGAVLQRIHGDAFGDDPGNWKAVPPFDGKPTRPVIVTHPANTGAVVGSDVSFHQETRGSAPLQYQWFFNRTNAVPSGTNEALSLRNVQLSDAGDYGFVVINPYGASTSRVARLTVGAAPVITNQPADVITSVGGFAEFRLGYTGSSPMRFQWYFNTNTPIPGDADYLMLFSIQPVQVGTYHVVVSNAWGYAVSRFAELRVTSAPRIDSSRLQVIDGQVRVSVDSIGGVRYQLEYKSALADPDWLPVEPAAVGNGAPVTLADTNTPFLNTRFYRIRSF